MASDPKALPQFLLDHAAELPDRAAAEGVVAAYVDTLEELRTHPFFGGPVRQDEKPSLTGPATFQRLSGRLDGLFLAMQWLAHPLADRADYDSTWIPAVLE